MNGQTRDSELRTQYSGLHVVQMHGEPGSGKSTLARALGRALPAVVIDKDVLKSALLDSGVPEAVAGPASYDALFSLAGALLAQGYNVVLDSPCGWPSIEQRGRALAAEYGARWSMVECGCPDDVLDRRLEARRGLSSQPRMRQDWYLRPGSRRPTCERLVLDSTKSVEELATEAVRYLTQAQRSVTPGPLSRSRERGSEPALRTQDSGLVASSGLGTRNSELSS
jgi:predicted kinase